MIADILLAQTAIRDLRSFNSRKFPLYLLQQSLLTDHL